MDKIVYRIRYYVMVRGYRQPGSTSVVTLAFDEKPDVSLSHISSDVKERVAAQAYKYTDEDDIVIVDMWEV